MVSAKGNNQLHTVGIPQPLLHLEEFTILASISESTFLNSLGLLLCIEVDLPVFRYSWQCLSSRGFSYSIFLVSFFPPAPNLLHLVEKQGHRMSSRCDQDRGRPSGGRESCPRGRLSLEDSRGIQRAQVCPGHRSWIRLLQKRGK